MSLSLTHTEERQQHWQGLLPTPSSPSPSFVTAASLRSRSFRAVRKKGALPLLPFRPFRLLHHFLSKTPHTFSLTPTAAPSPIANHSPSAAPPPRSSPLQQHLASHRISSHLSARFSAVLIIAYLIKTSIVLCAVSLSVCCARLPNYR